MKKIVLTILLAASIISCDDSLDRTPVDQLTPDTAYNSVDDLEFAVSGLYSSIPATGPIALNSIMSDNTKIGADNGGQQVQLFNFNISASNGLDQGLWGSYYFLSNLASRVIENAQDIQPEEGEQDQYDYILAQAYAFRAYAHEELMKYYTPNLTDPNGIAIPYVDYVGESTDQPARNTVSEVSAGIISDLDMAESLIGNNGGVDYVSRDFITFVRARLAGYTQNNTLAITHADELIANYSLATPEEYEAMFLDADNTEVIFKRVYTAADGRLGGAWYFTGTGGAFIEMSNELYNLLDPNDARYNVLYDSQNSDPSINLHLINKYPGSGGIDYLNDYKEMRVSEAYLIKAEAQARENMLAEAAQTIKELRDARFGSSTAVPNYDSIEDALDDVLAERRLELAYEGHRYIDLKRFNEGLDRNSLDCSADTAPCSLPATDYRFTLPIPFSELNANGNINENNPGY